MDTNVVLAIDLGRTDLQSLQHRRKILTCVQHRFRITQLRNDLLGTVLLPSSRRHRKSPCPLGSRPSYRLDQDFQGRPTSQRGKPQSIRVDNGPEFVSQSLDLWAYFNDVKLGDVIEAFTQVQVAPTLA